MATTGLYGLDPGGEILHRLPVSTDTTQFKVRASPRSFISKINHLGEGNGGGPHALFHRSASDMHLPKEDTSVLSTLINVFLG